MEKIFYNPNSPRKIIIRHRLSEGIFLVKRKSVYPLIEHYGVIVIGRHLESLGFYDKRPRVIHKTDSGIYADVFNANEWQRLKFVPANQVNKEIVRIKIVLKSSTYHLFFRNCEHFARFVVEGIEYSTQVQIGFVAVTAAVILLNNSD